MARALVWLGLSLLAAAIGPVGALAANVAVLMPGSSGITPGDFLVRNQASFERAGIRVVMTTSPSTAVETIAAEAAQGRKVVLVGMSKGSVDIAQALASGARPSGAVFVSGIHSRVMATLGSPDRLPPSLVVHHSSDVCRFTLPADAVTFASWSGGRAKLRWISTSGPPSDDPCNARGAHGFFRQDGAAVSAIIGFIKSH